MKYDVVVPLGMNCCSAFQLRHRGLRQYALPFDWVLMQGQESVRYMAHGFSNRFASLALKENLMPAVGPHWDPRSRYDRTNGFYFLHHFSGDFDRPGVYEAMYAKLRSRIDRLFCVLSHARTALIVMALLEPISVEIIEELKESLRQAFPDTCFTFRFVQFMANEYGLPDGDEFVAVNRRQSDYDMNFTSAEWSFLDDVDTPRRKMSRYDKIVRKVYKWARKRLVAYGIGSMRSFS